MSRTPVRRVLYNLREGLKATSLLIVEGEKDVETARKLGFVATCNSGGAGKWNQDYAECLRGKRVAIIADADGPGLNHGRQVAKSLIGIAASVRLIEALPCAKDLTKWIELDSGDLEGAAEQLREMIRETPDLTASDVAKWKPSQVDGFTLTRLSDLPARPDEPVDWVLENRLAAGTVSVVVAKTKVGKSTLARNLCLAVSRGEDFLGLKTKQGECIYLALEERESDIRDDFRAMGATGTEPIFIHAAAVPEEGMKALVGLMRERKPVLVVIDPLFRLARVCDESAYAEMYAALGPLIDAARETRTHILILHHSGKSAKLDAIDSPLGSTAIAGAVSTLIVLKRTEAYRTLQTVQRIGADLAETELTFDSERRTLSLGEEKSRADASRIEAAIMEYLQTCEEPKTETEICEAVEGNNLPKRKALRQLVLSGKLERSGTGKKGSPFTYQKMLASSLLHIPEERKRESEKASDTRMDIDRILSSEDQAKTILVPDSKQSPEPPFSSPELKLENPVENQPESTAETNPDGSRFDMETATEIIETLAALGVTIKAIGPDRLRIAPASKVPADLLLRIREAKPQLLAALQEHAPKGPAKAIQCLYDWQPGYRGQRLHCVAHRHEAGTDTVFRSVSSGHDILLEMAEKGILTGQALEEAQRVN